MALNKTMTFDLELKPGGIPPIVHASQGDIGRMFKANIYWDGSAATSYISGATVNLRGRKPDKTVFDYTATLAGSMVTFETTEQMTIISGPVECELVFSNDGDVIASANFVLIVEESPYDPNAISESEVAGLNAMIQAATPEAVADWFENDAPTSTTFTNAVQDATDAYLDENGVTVPEVVDIRSGYNGIDYSSAGVAIRKQTSDVNAALSELKDGENPVVNIEWESGKIRTSTGEELDGQGGKRSVEYLKEAEYISVNAGSTELYIIFYSFDGTSYTYQSAVAVANANNPYMFKNDSDYYFRLSCSNPSALPTVTITGRSLLVYDMDRATTKLYGSSNTITVSTNGSKNIDFSLYDETYIINFSNITQPLSVVGVYGLNERNQTTLLETVRSFTEPVTINPGKYYPSLRYYVEFSSTVGSVDITIENKSVDERINEKQDALTAGAGITIANNVISSTGRASGSMGIYSVKDFGAQGDGETIDTTAIQNCIIAAEAVGYEVYFPAGTYLIDDTITIHDASLRGTLSQDGNGYNRSNGVKIKATTAAGMIKIEKEPGTTSVTAITIKNIVLDGGANAAYCIFMNERRATLYDVYCENAAVGLKLTRIYNGLFVNSVFNNNMQYGIYMETACNNITFIGCFCGGNSRDANNVYANVYASNPTGTPSLENSNIKFIACELDAPYNENAYNFDMNDCCVLVFEKNYFEGAKAGLFTLSNVQGLNITDNYFIDVSMSVNDTTITGTFFGNSFKLYNKQSGTAICNLKSDAITGGNYIATGYQTQ